jgi:hypothetical protein
MQNEKQTNIIRLSPGKTYIPIPSSYPSLQHRSATNQTIIVFNSKKSDLIAQSYKIVNEIYDLDRGGFLYFFQKFTVIDYPINNMYLISFVLKKQIKIQLMEPDLNRIVLQGTRIIEINKENFHCYDNDYERMLND